MQAGTRANALKRRSTVLINQERMKSLGIHSGKNVAEIYQIQQKMQKRKSVENKVQIEEFVDEQQQSETGRVVMQRKKSYTIKEKEDLKKAQIQMIEDELSTNKNTLEFTKSSKMSKRDWRQKVCPDGSTAQVFYKYFILVNSSIVFMTIPLRVAFELKPRWYSLVLEEALNAVFLIDMIYTFNVAQQSNTSRKFRMTSATNAYLKSWFLFDLYSFFPLAYLRYISHYEDGGKDIWSNIKTLNFERLPRLYKLMLIPQIARGRNLKEYGNLLFDNIEMTVIYKNLMWTFLSLYYILHVSGCFWYAQIYANVSDRINWVSTLEIEDDSMVVKYFASVYWATVTCTTVGYGDITPTNMYEIWWAMVIMVYGVGVFSLFLSDLASQFADILNKTNLQMVRIQNFEAMVRKLDLGPNLEEEIFRYVRNQKRETDVEKNKEFQYLLKILPDTLSKRLSQFLFQNAISNIPFLQKRRPDFYSKFLHQLDSKIFYKDEALCRQDMFANKVYFIVTGLAVNHHTHKYYQQGMMVNIESVLRSKVSRQTITTFSKSLSCLYFTKVIFHQIIKLYPDILDQMEETIKLNDLVKKNDKFVNEVKDNKEFKNQIAQQAVELYMTEDHFVNQYHQALKQVGHKGQDKKNLQRILDSKIKTQESEINDESSESIQTSELATKRSACSEVVSKTEDVPIQVDSKTITVKYNLDALRKKKRELVYATDEDVENASFESQKPYKDGDEENFQHLDLIDPKSDHKNNEKSDTKADPQEKHEYHKLQNITSIDFILKIQQLRNKQKKLLPAYIQNMQIINQNQHKMKRLLNKNVHGIPVHIERALAKGQAGLKTYHHIMQNIDSVLVKNQTMVSQLVDTQEKIQLSSKLIAKQKLNVKKLIPTNQRKGSFENSDNLTDTKPQSNIQIEPETLFDMAELNDLASGQAATATPGLPPSKNFLELAKNRSKLTVQNQIKEQSREQSRENSPMNVKFLEMQEQLHSSPNVPLRVLEAPATGADALTEHYMEELKTIGGEAEDATVVNDSVDDLLMKAIEAEHLGFESIPKPNLMAKGGERSKKQNALDAIQEMLNKTGKDRDTSDLDLILSDLPELLMSDKESEQSEKS